MGRLRCQRGQATIDYVALIAVLAALLAAAATAAGVGAPGVTNAVLGQLQRALCIVTGRVCPAAQRAACVVSSDRDSHHVALSIAIVRIDEDRWVLRERMSDGTVRLTVAERDGAGAEVGVGASARVRLGGHEIGFEREAHGGAQGIVGHGEVHVARDDREADEILRAIRRRGPLPLGGPHPSEVFVDGGVRGLGRLGIGRGTAGGTLDAVAETVLGARRDERSGEVTISLGAGGSGWALLQAVMAGPSGVADRHTALALTLDRHGRPIALALNASGTLSAGSTLPAGLAGPLRVGSGDEAAVDMRGRRWELSANTDLRDPRVAAAWAAFRHDPSNPAAIRALGAQLRERAAVDVRSYAVRTRSNGVAAGLSAGLKLGGELDHTTDHSVLLSAATRPPGGLWEPRLDCL
ncbi:MAG: hypothetical protein QOI73_2211 [Solirubrobacteraceae bacterium]|nr:hypothetical protein [Solirubrobacteraceae bacterium]